MHPSSIENHNQFIWDYFLLLFIIGGSDGQKKTKVGTSIAGSDIQAAVDFECPEEFGYYPAPGDCTRYYIITSFYMFVCLFKTI